MLEEKKDTYVIESEIIPFLKTYLIENTVKINYKKLLNATQYISISLLAWLQAITEHKTSALHSIDWQNHNLHTRVHDLKGHFCIILEKELSKSRRIKHTEILPNKIKIYNEKICLVENKTSLSAEGKITAKNTVSPNLAIKLLDVMDEIILRKKYQKERMKQGLFDHKLHRHNLAQIDLTAVLSMKLRSLCKNSPVALVPDHLPKTIWLKYLAHYLAISSKKYSDYGDIEYDDARLLNNARGIHATIIDLLNSMLTIKLHEPHLMSPQHYEIAKNTGVIDIAVVATTSHPRTIRDDWSIEVTKELALNLLHQLPEFDYIFKENSQKTQYARKDAISEALLEIILPELSDKGHMLTKDINFVKLCWEELPNALKKIGCTDVILNKDGDKDEHSIQSKHESLNTPFINFHAFRQRIVRLVERATAHL